MRDFKYIITIGRQYGAGGRTAALQLSARLGIPCYDKEAIRATAQARGLSSERPEDRTFFMRHLPGALAADRAVLAQAQAMRDLARKGPCVLVGRGANFVLWDFPDLIRVFIHAEEEDRVRYAEATFGDSPEMARKRVRRAEAARQSFYHYLTGETWGDLTKYDLTLNSSLIGRAACADLILAYAQARQARGGAAQA